ncbi:hypothetical protein Lal_00050042 [Lupinus albus]|nr:hypothetical protein Lal_00050042 [Lupinus albus]
MKLRSKRRRPAKLNMYEEPKQGITKNKGNQKKPKVELTDSSHQKSMKHLSTTAVFEPHDDPVDTNKNSAYQALAGSSSPSIFSPEKSDVRTGKIRDSVSSEGSTENVPEVKESAVAEI